jgi:hypothetical protein
MPAAKHFAAGMDPKLGHSRFIPDHKGLSP